MDALEEILDRLFLEIQNYEEVSIHTKLQPQYKTRLKNIAARNGMTMGGVIEEMIEVYESFLWDYEAQK